MSSTLLEAKITPAGGGRGSIWDGEPFTSIQAETDPFGIPRNNRVGYHLGSDKAPRDGHALDWQPGWKPREIRFRRRVRLSWLGILHPGDDPMTTNGGYGNVAMVQDEHGTRYVLAHLDSFGPPIAAWIASGMVVSTMPWFDPGELIGVQGTTGNSTGVHTHFEMRRLIGGVYQPVNADAYTTGSPAEALPPKPEVPATPVEMDERVLFLNAAADAEDQNADPTALTVWRRAPATGIWTRKWEILQR